MTATSSLTTCFTVDLKSMTKVLQLLPRVLDQSGRRPDEIKITHISEGEESEFRVGYYLDLSELHDAAALEWLQKIVQQRKWTSAEFSGEQPDSEFRQSLPTFLERAFRLEPTDAVVSWHDLMVAVYEDSLLEDVFESAPKNPRQAIEIHFLAQHQDSTAERPTCIFTLPQASGSVDWHLWVNAMNRRRPGQKCDAVKLFYRVPSRSAAADYYIEYGYAHPLHELPELHRCRTNGWVMLAAQSPLPNGSAGQGRNGNRLTCDVDWLKIERRSHGEQISHVETASRTFHYLVPHNRIVPLTTIESPKRFKMEVRLHRAAPGQPVRLQSLSDQIQVMKSQLFRMERERELLLHRSEVRMRYLLCFNQSDAEGEDEQLAPAFERFLSMSEHLLDQFYYVMLTDSVSQRRVHVLLTTNAVLGDELHLGLTSSWYYQPEQWTKWHFNVFVEGRYELLPRIQERGLKEGFSQAFQDALRNSLSDHGPVPPGTERCVALRPNANLKVDDDDLHDLLVLVFDIPRHEPLAAHLELLNTAFPARELQSRELIREDIKRKLEEAAGDLDKQVDEIEDVLIAEKDRRLGALREQWNELTPKIEKALHLVTNQCDHFAEVDRMVESFETSWTEFSERFRGVTDSLVADKLRLMEQLDQEFEKWKGTIERVRKSHHDVQSDCCEMGKDMAARVAEAEDERKATADELKQAQQKYQETLLALRVLNKTISDAVAIGEQCATEIAQLEAEASKKVARLDAADRHVTMASEILKRHWGRFGNLIGTLRQSVAGANETVANIEKQADEIDALSKEWEQTLKDGEEKHARAVELARKTSTTTAATGRQLETVLHSADGEMEKADEELKKLKEKVTAVEGRLNQLKTRREEVRTRTEQLKKLEAEAESVARQLKLDEGELTELESRLKKRREEFWFHREKLSAELSEAMATLMRDLQTLAAAEVSFRDAVELHRSVRLKARMLRELRNARGLTEDEHREIWS